MFQLLFPRSLYFWCVVLLLALPTTSKSLADTNSRGLGPTALETELLSDLADGRLNQYSLVDAALILGGVRESEQLDKYRHMVAEHTVAACREVMACDGSEPRLSALLDYLHSEVLTDEYVEDCNDLRKALNAGQYNCVTATILYCHLARHCGLQVSPISLPGHVRVIGLNQISVEPTCAEWFEMHSSPDSAKADSEKGRYLSSVQLLAKLYYNRGLAFLRDGDHAAALAATEMSWQLDPGHERARDNVATVINNWALELCDEDAYEPALDLLVRGRELAGDHPLLHANERHIRQRWAYHKTTTQGTSQDQGLVPVETGAGSSHHQPKLRFRLGQ